MPRAVSNTDVGQTPQRQLHEIARAPLLEQLRAVFEQTENDMLQAGERTALCCELRRYRRAFIDSFLAQLLLRCEDPAGEWLIGTAVNASHARTFIYLSSADDRLRTLLASQEEAVGRLAAVWSHQTGWQGEALACPLSPHTLARLFFLLLPDLPAPLHVRCRIADAFLLALPVISRSVQHVIFTVLQRRGVLVGAMVPWPVPAAVALEAARTPSAAAQTLVVPPQWVANTRELARTVAAVALQGDDDEVAALLASHRQSALLPWLADSLSTAGCLPRASCRVLALLAGPLVDAACDPAFADSAHPARRVLEEFMHWAQGWQERLGIEGIVPEQCRELADVVAGDLLHGMGDAMNRWLDLLDYLLRLRKRVQQDTSASVASARLSLQVLDVRAEVEALLRERAALEQWPSVVIEILHGAWTALLMTIHWREGSASDAWLQALSVADQLLATVQPGVSPAIRQGMMRQVPQLLQGLRRGFDEVGCDRAAYSRLLERLERVHLALLQGQSIQGQSLQGQSLQGQSLQGQPLAEPSVFWPLAMAAPTRGEAFDVGSWLRLDNGSVQAVLFSDEWCTVLLDAHAAAPACHATARLQSDFCEGNLEVLSAMPPLLQAA